MGTQKIEEYRERFLKVMDLVNTVFGDKAFRRFVKGDENNRNGKWNMNQLNMSLYDIQMFGFVPFGKKQVISKADVIREMAIKLMTENDDFIKAIEMSTSDRIQLQTRFKIWNSTLEEIIGKSEKELRIFPFSVKRKLFENDPICQICKQRILHVDDTEVDHIIPYSKGGKTDIDNAQLAHRYCNRSKGNKDLNIDVEISIKTESDLIYTEEEKLAIANEIVKKMYFRLKDTILNINSKIGVKYTKFYIAFVSNSTNIVDIHVQNKALKIWINLKKGQIEDPKKIARDVSQIGHWGNGDYEISMKNEENFEYIVNMIRKSYNHHIH